MQFKKHFSSNLQNLSVKKTMIVNPPPQRSIIHQHYVDALPFDRNNDTFTHRQSLNDSHQSCNKQNEKSNQIFLEDYANNGKNSRKCELKDNIRMSPMLTFNKIKRSAIDMKQKNAQTVQEAHQKKYFQHLENNMHYQRANTFKTLKDNADSSRNLHSFMSNTQKSNKNIRLGSMVFGSLLKRQGPQAKREQKSTIRQSRSFDRLCDVRTERNEQSAIQCMNNDGQQAKYKVIKHESQNEELLYYCFNCAIFLVKQGFSIDQLTGQDRTRFKTRHSDYMSKSDFYRNQQELTCSRNSVPKRPLIQNEKVKIGEQMKCKIIMKLNKLKVNREEFNKNIETHLENIDYFYHSLISYIQQQRLSDRQEIIRVKSTKKSQPEKYESQLSSSLGTIDYMMKNLQEVNYEFLKEVEILLQNQVTYPKLRINMEPIQGFQGKIDQFSNYFQNNLKICLEQQVELSKYRNRRTSQTEQSIFRNHSLRFSFQDALKQSSRKKTVFQSEIEMNSLQQENQSQLEQSLPIVERRQNAFRNLFPQETDQYQESEMERIKQSPVFKQF